MLWVDSRLVSVEDLLSVDSEVKDIAEAESLVLTGDTSVINRGVDDAGSVLRRHLNLGELPANDISLRDVVQPFTGLAWPVLTLGWRSLTCLVCLLMIGAR